jgi:hypothetical protein
MDSYSALNAYNETLAWRIVADIARTTAEHPVDGSWCMRSPAVSNAAVVLDFGKGRAEFVSDAPDCRSDVRPIADISHPSDEPLIG